MKYYFIKTLFFVTFDKAIQLVTEELKKQGFEVLTEIDVQETLKQKLNVDFRKYRIFGVFNPSFFHKALKAELNIGTMMPYNVVVMEMDDGKIRVSSIEPVASILAVSNTELDLITQQINAKLKTVINNL
ncbi:hypothetical protein MNBD_BACTEROID01-1137 [hydrothermal vent metagenome]|uniref:DUF302 domain-containing protein n=1 Tax=hydrothermal vent metagenome TaxID=652676 RepID=A0A3B0TQ84_9ZZZZ